MTPNPWPRGTLLNPGWFRIEGGERDGRLRISGWMGSAIKGDPLGSSDRMAGWLSYSTCPICHAMVVSDEYNPAHGDHTWPHEKWHARTDFPVPAELLTDADREAGYAPAKP